MRKTLFTMLTATALFGFADESINTFTTVPVEQSLPTLLSQSEFIARQGFFYVRFAAAESDLVHASSIYPGLGIGYRRLAGDGAVDISLSGIGHAEGRRERIFWNVPRGSYMHYLEPNATQSAYMGGGLAWGGISSKNSHFIGIIPSFIVGYEFARKTSFLGFTELTISQPTLSVFRKGPFPGPCAEFSTGIGF